MGATASPVRIRSARPLCRSNRNVDSMPQFFIDRPVFAWVVALAISLAGLLAIPNLPVSQYPEVAPPSVTINANYPGASVDDVAESVASIIENELNGAKG